MQRGRSAAVIRTLVAEERKRLISTTPTAVDAEQVVKACSAVPTYIRKILSRRPPRPRTADVSRLWREAVRAELSRNLVPLLDQLSRAMLFGVSGESAGLAAMRELSADRWLTRLLRATVEIRMFSDIERRGTREAFERLITTTGCIRHLAKRCRPEVRSAVPTGPDLQCFSAKTRAAYEFIKREGPVKGDGIAAHIHVSPGHFRDHYVPQLKKLGVQNNRDHDGYWVPL